MGDGVQVWRDLLVGFAKVSPPVATRSPLQVWERFPSRYGVFGRRSLHILDTVRLDVWNNLGQFCVTCTYREDLNLADNLEDWDFRLKDYLDAVIPPNQSTPTLELVAGLIWRAAELLDKTNDYGFAQINTVAVVKSLVYCNNARELASVLPRVRGVLIPPSALPLECFLPPSILVGDMEGIKKDKFIFIRRDVARAVETALLNLGNDPTNVNIFDDLEQIDYHSLGLARWLHREWYYKVSGSVTPDAPETTLTLNKRASMVTAGRVPTHNDPMLGYYQVYGSVLLLNERAADLTLADFDRFVNAACNGYAAHVIHANETGGAVDFPRLQLLDAMYHEFGDQFDPDYEVNLNKCSGDEWEIVSELYHVTRDAAKVRAEGKLRAFKARDAVFDRPLVVTPGAPAGVFFSATLIDGQLPRTSAYPRGATKDAMQDRVRVPLSSLDVVNRYRLFLVKANADRGHVLLLLVHKENVDVSWAQANTQECNLYDNDYFKFDASVGQWSCRRMREERQLFITVFVVGDVQLQNIVHSWDTVMKK